MSQDSRTRLEERNRELKRMRKEYMTRFYREAVEAGSRKRPIVHTTALGPTEIFNAMGLYPVIAENYVTITCAKQEAKGFCETAEQSGFSNDLCSYFRCGLGMMYRQEGPMGAMPAPDLVVGMTGVCDPYVKWWETWAMEYNVPFYLLDMPFNLTGELQDHELEWMVSSLKGLADFIEEQNLGKLDESKFQETVALSVRAMELFWEVYEMKKTVPCPRGLRESAGDLFYAVTSLGKQEAVDYYALLLEDTRERVEHRVGIVQEEKVRLLWDNIPLWYRLQLIDYLAERGAVIPVDGYIPTIWLTPYLDGRKLDPEKPWECIALRLWSCMQNASAAVNHKRYDKLVREWGCDGAIFLSNRSCINITGVVLDKMAFLEEKLETPSITFDADMADPRSFAEAQVHSRIDAFLELLEQKKR